MRQVINKLISEEDLFAAVESAYSQGWRRMKLYFLTGLPTETDEDTEAIIEMAQVREAWPNTPKKSICNSVSWRVCTKPFTPFQWFGRNTEKELHRKIRLAAIKQKSSRGVQFKWHDTRFGR